MIRIAKNSTLDIVRNPFFKLLIVSSIFTIWVLWIQFYWLFFGIIILVDVFITHKVTWRFWRKRLPEGQKHKWYVELFDSLLWAFLIAAFVRIFLLEAFSIPTSSMEKTLTVGDYILVTKLTYGPRLPMTPLAIPFAHNSLPGTKLRRSYMASFQKPFRRLGGISDIKRFDVVVFNYPEGDTVIKAMPEKSYYTMVRQFGHADIKKKYSLMYRPVDKRDNYIKRVVGLPGDTVRIIHGQAYINNIPEEFVQGIQHNYSLKIHDAADTLLFKKLGISGYDIQFNGYNSIYTIPLTANQYHTVIDSGYFKAIVQDENVDPTSINNQIFPFNEHFTWTDDNYGPIMIPYKGWEIELTTENLPLYERIIIAYEGNTLRVRNRLIYINDMIRHTYTFKMNYYFMMGDNRDNSNDSRYWGFVPEDHIIGKARCVWFSVDKNKSFPHNIRWNKMAKFIN